MEGRELEAIKKDTTLTAYFKLNIVDEDARQLYYYEIPEKFIFSSSDRQWKPRK